MQKSAPLLSPILIAGWLGSRHTRKHLLADICAARTLVAAFMLAPITPITPGTKLLFSVAMGSLWLAKVPLSLWPDRAYLRAVRHGHVLRDRVLLVSAWQLSRRVAGRAALRPVRWLLAGGVDRCGGGAFSALALLPVRERPLAAA